MPFHSRRDTVYTILAGIFITNAVVAEIIGGKLIQAGPFLFSIGIIPWPVVFLTTDVINEYYGYRGVRRLTFITAGLITYAFAVLFVAMRMRGADISPVTDEQFSSVFGQSLWIIAGSITAFVLSQIIDVALFRFIRKKTGKRHIWLRATGSTVFSQLIDTFVVLGIAFRLPGKISAREYLNAALTGYTGKLILAVALTPLIYLGHALVERYLGAEAEELSAEAARAE